MPGPKLACGPSATKTPTAPGLHPPACTVQLISARDSLVSSVAGAMAVVPFCAKRHATARPRSKLAPRMTIGVPRAAGPLAGRIDETTASAV